MALTHGMDVQRVRTIAPKLVAVAGKCGDVASDGTAAVEALGRQALHARMLAFIHPSTGDLMRFEVAMPADMARVAEELRRI